MKSKAITLEQSIDGLWFFDKEFFLTKCKEHFPLAITILLSKNTAKTIIPLYLAAIKLKLKGFIVKV